MCASSVIPPNLFWRAFFFQVNGCKYCDCCLTQVTETESERLSAFFSRNTYISGKYDDESSFCKLDTHIMSLPGGAEANRLFYLALPPTVYHEVTKNIKQCCMSKKWVDMPFSYYLRRHLGIHPSVWIKSTFTACWSCCIKETFCLTWPVLFWRFP